jgi:hypothetical protein
MPLRFRLPWDGELCREVPATFLSAVFAHYRDATGLAAPNPLHATGGNPLTPEESWTPCP